ncbi:MAG: antibiotic biosynthesis monooxygenase [Geobacter sp.]|nr:antibiotic biosynthesis monooxygenase [Geobacter sp.]
MSTVTIVAKLIIKEAAVAAVKAEMLKLVTPTRQEAGCLEYRLHQDNAEPNLFIFYENWQSMASFEQHLNTPHYKSYSTAIEGAIAEKTVHKMTCISG